MTDENRTVRQNREWTHSTFDTDGSPRLLAAAGRPREPWRKIRSASWLAADPDRMFDDEVASPGNTKKTRLDSIEKTKLDRRLVEYFVVVSAKVVKRETASSRKQKQVEWLEDNEFGVPFRPFISARYPLHDHVDNPLHENVTFFCHPSGGIQVRANEELPKVHYFVATGGTGRQLYGTCLTLWEPFNLESGGVSSQLVFVPKCLVVLSVYPYLIAFREYLTQLSRLCKQGMPLPIERYIVNFSCELPAPPPGAFEVQTTILDSVIKIWSLPHNLPVAWVSLPFRSLFECLDIDNIILVWHCMVLERQVLITSTQLSLLTLSCEIFLSLMFPMRWSHAYIPVLPHFLIPILSAPMPFLCGIHKANLADAMYDLSRDCILCDLDKNTVTFGPDTPSLPPLPPQCDAKLRDVLEMNVGMIFREARSLTKQDDYSNSGAHLPTHVKLMAEAMWEAKLSLADEAFHLAFTPEEARKNHLNGNDSSGLEMMESHHKSSAANGHSRKQSEWDAAQEAFLDTFVYLLRNYRKFLVFPSKHNEGSYGGAGFRSKEFIESQRFDMRDFLEQFIATQMFDNFITKRLYGSGEADVAFFDQAVDRFLKNAGLFADVDLSGRLLDASGFKSEKRSAAKPRSRATRAAARNEDPLLQSARIHRMLKTIVPPEPTGEGLPPELPGLNGSIENAKQDDDDEASVYSASSRSASKQGASGPQNDSTRSTSPISTPRKPRKSLAKYVYSCFPSEFNAELFGIPRPLPAAVIAEFDRQRKDAARFRRKAPRKPEATHYRRAHAVIEPLAPPSPEVATFTVFFTAFTAMVGKELVEMAKDEGDGSRTILSTYVPTSAVQDDDTDVDSEVGDSVKSAPEDRDEKEHVATMKTHRPDMGGMFEDEDEEVSAQADTDDTRGLRPVKAAAPELVYVAPVPANSFQVATDSFASDARTNNSEESKPRERFRDKLSDLQIEEAKVTGRAQLGLAFEMLTMLKKRGLKADPEAYQCLIDACGRVGDTKRATDLLAKMHEDGIVADGTVYACLVSAFSSDSAWKDAGTDEDLPEWANSTAVEMDWNKLQKRSLLDRMIGKVVDADDDESDNDDAVNNFQKIRNLLSRRSKESNTISASGKKEDSGMEFYVTETVERQIALGENLLEIVFPDISIDTENEVCPRCNFLLSDDDVVVGWMPNSNDYTTSCPNCTQRFVPHFCVQCSAPTFIGSKGAASPLLCERLSPWVLQKEIRSVMSERDGIDNLLSPRWREEEYKNSVLWWNLVLSCMRYRFPFSFLLQGSFDQNLISPLPEDDN